MSDATTKKTARDAIQEEYDRCKHLWQNPAEAPELFGVSGLENVASYYTYRTEALGFALDKFSQEDRGAL